MSTLQVLRHTALLFGFFFTAPISDTDPQGLQIFNSSGESIFFHEVQDPEFCSDFRIQRYHNIDALTWWQGQNLETGVNCGSGFIHTNHAQIAVSAHGLCADAHEFQLTHRGSALMIANEITVANLTHIGGNDNQSIVNSVVHEIDIASGQLLFEWNAADFVPFTATNVPLPIDSTTPWQWFHANAVKVDWDGHLIISSRFTWSIYKVHRITGQILWVLGGKDNQFHGQGNWQFKWQHAPLPLSPNEYLLFDNEFMPGRAKALAHPSRLIRFRLSANFTVTLISSYQHQPNDLLVPFQGNGQLLQDGRVVVGWGPKGYVSIFSSAHNETYDAKLNNSYSNRIYYFPSLPQFVSSSLSLSG
jgi:hypothetical protein